MVKEEKLLVLALESEDTKEISTAIKAVLKNCIKTRGIKVETLPTFDIEFLFLNIRGKSVGEDIELSLICPDDGETTVPVTISIDDIKMRTDEDHQKQIKISDDLMMEMKYPSLDEFIKNNFDFGESRGVDESFNLIASCIDKIYNEEEVWTTSDCTKKEMTNFLEQLSSKQFKEVEKFFNTMPKLSHEVKITNPNTKVESSVVIEGLASFFG